MDKSISQKVKALIAENELDAALDLMLGAGQTHGQERHHTLLLLKNRLAMLKEQELAGMLEFEEVMRQKAKIAHALLKMTEGKNPAEDLDPPQLEPPPPGRRQSAGASPAPKILLIGTLAVAAFFAGFFIVKSMNDKPGTGEPEQITREEAQPAEDLPRPRASNGTLRLLDFPKLDQPFNFSDIQYTFREASLEKYSDGSSSDAATLKLTLKMDLVCRSNLGVCYREEIRILADGKPVAPAERENLAGWMEHNSSAKDVQTFIFDADATEYHIELEKNKSFWRRPFKILM